VASGGQQSQRKEQVSEANEEVTTKRKTSGKFGCKLVPLVEFQNISF